MEALGAVAAEAELVPVEVVQPLLKQFADDPIRFRQLRLGQQPRPVPVPPPPVSVAKSESLGRSPSESSPQHVWSTHERASEQASHTQTPHIAQQMTNIVGQPIGPYSVVLRVTLKRKCFVSINHHATITSESHHIL